MSDYKPITGELRNGGWRLLSTVVGDEQYVQKFDADKFDQLCDAIDAIHANLERENDRLRCELDRVQGEQEERDGWICLPVDVDGVPICIGDELVDITDTSHRGKARSIELREDGCEWIVFVGSLGRWSHVYRHVKPDSWESIIYDAMQAGQTDTAVDVTPLIERCKALCECTKGGDVE